MKNYDESELNKCVKERKLLQFRLVITNFEISVTIMCRNDELDDELSWLFTNGLSATR